MSTNPVSVGRTKLIVDHFIEHQMERDALKHTLIWLNTACHEGVMRHQLIVECNQRLIALAEYFDAAATEINELDGVFPK